MFKLMLETDISKLSPEIAAYFSLLLLIFNKDASLFMQNNNIKEAMDLGSAVLKSSGILSNQLISSNPP